MKRNIVLVFIILVCEISFAKRISIYNNTGETISLISVSKQDSSFKNVSDFEKSNILNEPLENGGVIFADVSDKVVKIYGVSYRLQSKDKVFLIPQHKTNKKKINITESDLVSDYSDDDTFEFGSFNNDASPRVMIKIKNQTDFKIYSIYCINPEKKHQNNNSIMPIIHSLIVPNNYQKVFFFPDLKTVRDDSGRIIDYKGSFDFLLYGIDIKGRIKRFEIPDFDVVNEEEIVLN